MGVFLVTAIKRADHIGKAISERFERDFYRVPETNSWFVAFPGTTKELSDEIGITEGKTGTAVIIPVENYYGRAPTDMWEWLKNRMERP